MSQPPVPKRMRALQRDSRGYPVPFIVMRDKAGKPLFACNNTVRQARAVIERRCPICGSWLDPVMWWAGGPMSAFHERGAYNDSAMHYECMEYALQVCPYLAMPNYLGTVTDHAAKQATAAGAKAVIEHTMLPGRPSVFVAVAARRFQMIDHGTGYYSKPDRPYLEIQYWRHGKRISEDEAAPLINERGMLPEQRVKSV